MTTIVHKNNSWWTQHTYILNCPTINPPPPSLNDPTKIKDETSHKIFERNPKSHQLNRDQNQNSETPQEAPKTYKHTQKPRISNTYSPINQYKYIQSIKTYIYISLNFKPQPKYQPNSNHQPTTSKHQNHSIFFLKCQ